MKRILGGAVFGVAVTYALLLFVAPDTKIDRAFTYLIIGLVGGAALSAATVAARRR